jgi:hypothetical protein
VAFLHWVWAQHNDSPTCNMLSKTSLPAAAGSRPVTRPRPLAADHLHRRQRLSHTVKET